MDPNQQTFQPGAPTSQSSPVPPINPSASTQPPIGEPAGQVPPSAPPVNSTPPLEHGTCKTRNIIAILLLVFFYFIGVIYVFLFTKWPKWVKFLVCLPLILGILIIILSVVIIAVNPNGYVNKQDNVRTDNSKVVGKDSQANNTKRLSNVAEILNAVGLYSRDHKGVLPSGITTTVLVIGDGSGQADICKDLIPSYMKTLPADPKSIDGVNITKCSGYETGYTIVKDVNNKVTVAAPRAEKGIVIKISR